MPLETISENETLATKEILLTNEEIMAKPLLERLEYIIRQPKDNYNKIKKDANGQVALFLQEFKELNFDESKLPNKNMQKAIKEMLGDKVKERIETAVDPKETLSQQVSRAIIENIPFKKDLLDEKAKESIQSSCDEYIAKKSDPLKTISRLVKQVLKACGFNVSVDIQKDELAENIDTSIRTSFAAKIREERKNAQAISHSPSP